MVVAPIRKRPQLRLLRRWGRLKPGDIITPLTGARRTQMLKRGIAELVSDDSEIETATAEPAAQEARLMPPVKRRRGRPPKNRTHEE